MTRPGHTGTLGARTTKLRGWQTTRSVRSDYREDTVAQAGVVTAQACQDFVEPDGSLDDLFDAIVVGGT
jgi:hypothetical protein